MAKKIGLTICNNGRHAISWWSDHVGENLVFMLCYRDFVSLSNGISCSSTRCEMTGKNSKYWKYLSYANIDLRWLDVFIVELASLQIGTSHVTFLNLETRLNRVLDASGWR